MKTFVIRCNDSVEAVVIGDEQFANAEMERRRAAHENDSPWDWHVKEFDAVVQEEEPETKEDDLGCFR